MYYFLTENKVSLQTELLETFTSGYPVTYFKSLRYWYTSFLDQQTLNIKNF